MLYLLLLMETDIHRNPIGTQLDLITEILDKTRKRTLAGAEPKGFS